MKYIQMLWVTTANYIIYHIIYPLLNESDQEPTLLNESDQEPILLNESDQDQTLLLSRDSVISVYIKTGILLLHLILTLNKLNIMFHCV